MSEQVSSVAISNVSFAEPTDIVPNQWYAVYDAKALRKKPTPITRMGEPLILYRDSSGKPHCFLNRCPHRGVEFTNGRVFGDDLECPFHAFRFGPDGQCTLAPCEGADARIPSRLRAVTIPAVEENDLIWIWWGASAEALGMDKLPPTPWIDGLPSTPYTSQGQFLWPVSHRHAIENSVDGHHAPALHGQRRGWRGWKVRPLRKRMRVEPLECDVKPTSLDSTYWFRHDSGYDPKPFRAIIRYQEPGILYASINDGLHLLSIDSPVDANNSWRITRYYNGRVEVPVVGHIVAWLMRVIDVASIQWNEDYWVVKSQRDPIPGVTSNNMVGSDKVVTQYFSMQHRLLAEAETTRQHLPPIVARHFAPIAKVGRATELTSD